MSNKSKSKIGMESKTAKTIEGNDLSQQFVKFLNDEKNYASKGKMIHTPTLSDSIAHLKLLNAFHKLKQSIIVGVNSIPKEEKLWQCYVTMAVRKFIIFISALKSKFSNDDSSFEQFMNQTLPSLDVLLVWHAFLLNPRAIYDNFLINDFKSFVEFPFPLYRINEAISNETLIFKPEPQVQEIFTIFIEDHLTRIGSNECFRYDAYQPFDPFQINLPIMCPICHIEIGNRPLTTKNFTGIADKSFRLISKTNCCCGFADNITYEQLQRRKLVSDSQSNNSMPSINKYFSPDVTKRYKKDRTVSIVDNNVRSFVKANDASLKMLPLGSVISLKVKSLNRFSLLVLRDYFESNPIYLTVLSASTIPIQEDLVACVIRQERFVRKMVELNWLFSSFIELTIDEAIERYQNFFQLMKVAKHPVVPTLDIDLIWHTHQLSQSHYFDYSRRTAGYVVDHNDKIEENRLNYSFENTCTLYRKTFKQDYSICLCWYCSANRKNLRQLFSRKENKNPLVSNENNLSTGHISAHNAIKVDTAKGKSISYFVNKKYKSNPLSGNYPAPWNDVDLRHIAFNDIYVNNPKELANSLDSHIPLYKNGLCGAVLDATSACAGIEEKADYGSSNQLIARGTCVGSGAFTTTTKMSSDAMTFYAGCHLCSNRATRSGGGGGGGCSSLDGGSGCGGD